MRPTTRAVVGALTLALLATSVTTGAGVAQAASARAALPPAAVVVPVADNPSSIEVSPTGRYAYLTAASDNVVSVVDLSTKKLVGNIPVGSDPLDAALNDRGTILYVANARSGSISVLDTRTRTVKRTLTIGGFPSAIDVRHGPTGDVLYVADLTADSVSQVNPATAGVTATWSIDEPADVVITHDGRVVVPSGEDSAVLVINARTGAHQTLQRPDGGSANLGAAAGSGTIVALPADVGTTWLNTRTMTFSPTVPPIAPGVTSGSDLILGERYTLLTTRDPVDNNPRVPGNVSVIRARDGQTVAVVPVGVGPRAVAASPRGMLVAQGPAENGQFSLLILPRQALIPGHS